MNFARIVRLFVAWQLLIVIITAASFSWLPLRATFIGGSDQASLANPQPYIRNPLLYSRANFDGIHYVDIARKGYGYAQQAFFPLYPKLITLLSPYVHPPALAGILVSLAGFLAGLVFLSRLMTLDHRPKIVFWTILALLVFPTSFFFGSVYTEGLFFFFSVSAFYFARSRRWWVAGIIGLLASYTRFIGVFLLPALLIEWWTAYSGSEKGPKPAIADLMILFFIPVGLVIFMHYLIHTTGDPLAFLHVQKLFGQGRSDEIILIYQVFWRYLKMIFTVNRADPLYLTIWLELITGILGTVSSVILFFRSRPSYAFFNLASFLTPTLSGTFTSVPRYLLLCFPSFILLGEWLGKTDTVWRRSYLFFSLILLVLFTSLFVRGYWVS
ncbi:MAG: hypothetical protein UX91_C0002G0015 [Candidatus Amesbacteria bacterium GW2011_GWB1_47_19]|nr:MAG: hypothetical protein UW51_C0004G0015 [Candidatus Amesbacteria bacterium GW2011_GWA1_44_24]KKU31690.1 MAG: integral membrane protein [Candidatus Amesbacteria bacterium GW2011_GWC1_46_24]KKU67603.1 MAG: hypothetical protein UX91_C0002G0015 [Candidatus Amesbacteria bacterium GW2011_GWB1_47_19]OGD06453.1 MAG: hypothetical protein A2379_02325 [Candidatus Amesbacteria bacterium RIFOXYB1_FULL_47_13]HBC72857.1 hypothetical protein [Candidatus Amesbacteria bacterium]